MELFIMKTPAKNLEIPDDTENLSDVKTPVQKAVRFLDGISKQKSVSVNEILSEGMAESQQARILLIEVSRRLFVALTCALLLGGVIVAVIYWFNQNDKITGSVTTPIVMICGAVGGFVGIQARLRDLTLMDLALLVESKTYLILAPFVGGVLALVLYLLFLSELLQGDLFPTFVAHKPFHKPAEGFFSIANQHAEDGYSDYAKLMFWCFLAGFSERFVTDVIGKFEGNAVKTIK